MSGSTISTTITQTVTLGSATYPSPLTVSASGVVTPTLASAIGITATLAASYLDNLGVVNGAAGYGTGHGGYGVYFTAGGTLLNDGTIAGGYGPEIGGAAVRLSDGVVINHGTLRGGAGGDGGQFTGDGLVGLQNDTIINTGFISGMYAGSNSSIINSGLISVGSFAVFPTISNNDSGGYGIFMGASSVDGSLLNTGTIAAGAVGDYGGIGVFAGSGDTVTNHGTILGGSGTALGGDGVKVSPNDMVINTGFIQGGSGSIAGAGVYLHSQSTLNNQGTIIGGYGASYGNGSRFISDDFVVNGATTDSSALILGNDGVVIQGNSTLINYATISGRNNGLYIEQTISTPASVTNQATGTITGADFGVYLKSTPSFASTGMFTNAGLITGQENGFVEYGLGGTIFNTGSIIGLGAGTPPFADGIFIEGGAEIINGASNATAALISGTGLAFGVDMIKPFVGTLASTGTVINFGTIQGGSLEGVALNAGTVINGTALDSQALITGIKIAGANALVQNFGTLNGDGQTGNALYVGNAGIVLNGAANDTTALIETTAVQNVQLDKNNTLTNYGSIIGGTVNGVYAQSGLISNASTGVIIGGKWGAHVAGYGAQTVINAGLIEGTIALAALANYAYSDVFANSGTIASLLGSAGTAIAFAKGNDLLIDDPTGVFIGTVSGGAGDNTLELAAGGPGSITGIGTQFTQFANINFDAGASWSAEGNLAGLAAGQTINGFAAGDTIILDGFTETGFTYVSGAGLELAGAGTAGATIDIAGSFDTTSFLVQTVAAGTEITKLVTGPVIGGTFLSPQAVTDGQPFNAFGNVTITDAGSGGAETATITMTNAGTATDDNGTLTGTGLTKTATGTYTLTAGSPAALQAALRAVVFTPAVISGATLITNSGLATGLTLQVSDGVAPAVTDTHTMIYTLLGSAPLTATFAPVPGALNEFTSQERTGATSYVNTPVSQTVDASAIVITAVLNGQTVFQQSFDLPYSDPAVQAAVAQADQILATDNATASTPSLTSSQVTNETPQTTTVITGEQTASPVFTVTTLFGPDTVFTALDVNGVPDTTVTLQSGQVDFNTLADYGTTTIDQTVTTTTTQLTTQTYTITGTPLAGPVIGGTYTAPQAVTDGQPFNAFGNVTITDAGSSGAETATITMTNAGTATDDNGTLTGTGLTKTATGTYTLTADSPAALQAALRAVVFTPALVDTSSNLTTGLSLQVSDGVAAPVTDTNTVIDTVLGPQPLTATFAPVLGEPNQFTSSTRTAETVDANTPVSQTDNTSATVITAVLNGQTVFQQSFDLPYSDPAVQAAIAQADQILATDNATASAPGLTSSAVTNQGSQTTTVVTGQQTSVVPTVTTVFGPGPLFTGLDVNGTPNTTVTLLAGQEDTNVNDDYQTTVDQTVTTTTTQLTTQTYTITGTESATCFAAGTKILTVNGPVAVQDLSIGDMLPTLQGEAQIKWIGRRDYDGRFIAGNHLMLPVRIRRHALARNVPSRDLVVSPGHGIYLDGVFVPAWRLVNGVSITQALQVETVSYFHIELADHAVIFAQNCPVESFLDDGCRRQFSNAPTFDDLYPDDAHAMAPCAPRAEHGFHLAEIQRRMAARAGILPASQTSSALRGFVDQAGPDIVTGWAQLIDQPEAPVSLDILAGGRHVATVLANQYRADLRAAGLGSGCHAFSYVPPRNLTGPVEVRGSSNRTILPKTTAAEILAA